MGRCLSKLASEYPHWVWNDNVPLYEWNSGREWKDDGWQHYELFLKARRWKCSLQPDYLKKVLGF